MSFSGVDGAGKTTILMETKKIIEDLYGRDVVVLRQRPSVLPILSAIKYGKAEAEKRTVEVLPRSGTNKSIVSSYIRFFYYLSDYLFGQFYAYFKYSLNGTVILYDRFYFDYLADPKRANLIINRKFALFFYKFLIKPKRNIFLYAEANEILRRKQELSKKDIESLTRNYLETFEGFSNPDQYISINNQDLDQTMKIVKSLVIEELS